MSPTDGSAGGGKCRASDAPRSSHTRLHRFFLTNTFLAGVFALAWLILRSGPKPSRFAYPCQQAALSTASLAFGVPVVSADWVEVAYATITPLFRTLSADRAEE